MVVAILGGAGLVLGMLVSLAVGSGLGRTLLLGVVGVAAWVMWFVYLAAVAECDPNKECEEGLAWFFALFILAGWLVGVLVGSAIRRSRTRSE